MNIEIGELSVDATDIGSQGTGILGIRGAGKSYTATFMAEQYHDAGIPFIAFDPIGIWRFLRVAGKGQPIPVVVAGGLAGDLPLTPESAPEIVRAAMRSRVSLVLDLYSMELSKADWRKIVRDCVRVLLYENGPFGLRHVFIEEAAEFVPQKPIDGLVFAEVEKLARMGGNAKLGYTLINQRAEEVSKSVLELCDNLFLHRQRGKNSLISLGKWLDAANVKPPKEITDALPMLPAGECFVWLGGTERPVLVRIPEKRSFHPDRTSMLSDTPAATVAPIDVGEFVVRLRAELQALPSPQAAQAAAKSKTTSTNTVDISKDITSAEARGYQAGYRAGADDQVRAIDDAKTALMSQLAAAVDAAFMHITDQRELPLARDDRQEAPLKPTPVKPRPPVKYSERTVEHALKRIDLPAKLPGAAGKLLAVMDTNPPVLRTWGQFAALAGIKARGGHFLTGRKHLLETGQAIEEGGRVRITTPSSAAGKPPRDAAGRVEQWAAVLAGPAPAILRFLFEHGGTAKVSEIAQGLGLQPRGGHWLTGWKQLRDNDIVVVANDIASLTASFMPKAVR